MPLSEDEQRILQEIERNFYDSDPAFAREVSTATLTRNATRNLRLSMLGFVAGLVILILLFTRSVLFGFVGFAVMVASAFAFYVNFSKLGKANLPAMGAKTTSISELLENRSQKLRERFKKDEQ
ncbi:MAG TPA: DUF3040 domain-containing protein [Acidimicrobiales bacterium]|nr:DUF3040 domain-containing protein [Acidimicrobiales bacterium]